MLDLSEYEFDAEGLLQKFTDRNGNITTYKYIDDKLTLITDPVGLETKFVYSGDQVEKIIDPDGRETKFTYEGSNLVSIRIPMARIANSNTTRFPHR